MNIILTLLCVLAIAVGQILFKLASNALIDIEPNKIIPSLFFNGYLWLALIIYGGATLGWVWLLSNSDLHKIYPFMALSFIIVPALSWIFLDEKLSYNYIVGIIVIAVGIIITVK